MLHVRENNDELFREAASHYPVNTATGDWQNFKHIFSVRKKKYYFLFPVCVWLCLILMPLVATDIIFTRDFHFINPIDHFSTTENKSSPGKSNIHPSTTAESSVNKDAAIKNHIRKTQELQAKSGKYSLPEKQANHLPPADISVSNINKQTGTKLAIDEDKLVVEANLLKEKNIQFLENRDTESQNKKIENLPGKARENFTGQLDTFINLPSLKEPLGRKHKMNFYAGFSGGIDITQIKMQHNSHPGYNYGLLAGLNINNRWEIETGIFLETRYYETTGKNFSSKNLTLPSYINIMYAKGNCKMLEIPFDIHFIPFPETKSKWYISAGISSYLMTKENYVFTVNYNNRTYDRAYMYTKDRSTLLAGLTIGGGFSTALGKSYLARLAPYIQLPISGAGTGLLKLQSAGLRVAIIRNTSGKKLK
ncbi:MAG: outer membrane beta-barrel protein [Ferruginibacter sp.]